MQRLEAPLPVPPHAHSDGSKHDTWMRMGEALMETARGEAPHFAVVAYARLGSAYKSGNAAAFNSALADYRSALKPDFSKELRKAKHEQLFNFAEPFYRGMVLTVLAALLAVGFWFSPVRGDWLRRSAFWLMVLTWVVLVAGLITRMVLEGRPPVTNLYSSAIFISWGAVTLGLVLEMFWKNSIGVVVAAVCGFLCLIIAHHLSLTGDTMEMMRAVLDTNFWLATHVVIITLGYSSAFIAGFLAIVYVVRGFFTTGLESATAKSLAKMV